MMAQQQKFIKQKIDLECPICTEQYHLQIRHPYIICLSQHHVCMNCIKNIIFKNKALNQPAQCPMCKTPVYQDKVTKFRFYSDLKEVKQMVSHVLMREGKLKSQMIEIQRLKEGTTIDLMKEKSRNETMASQLRKAESLHEQAKANNKNMQMQLKKSEKQIQQKQQKISQKNKIIFTLIGICDSFVTKMPNQNHEVTISKIKKIREQIEFQQKQMFIKYRFNNPEKIINNIQNLIFLRTIIGISAKSTMKKPLELMKSIIIDAFNRINDFITQKNFFVKFQLKVMLYRNYNNTFDQIFQESEYQTKPQKIKSFLAKSDGKGQWQTQAIQVMLQKINNLGNVDQVFLVADSEANNEKNTHNKRQFLGEKYWNKYGYPKTTFQVQLSKAKDKYPIHSIYVDKADFFKRVSAETKGDCKHLDMQNLQEKSLVNDFICNHTFSLLQKKIKNANVKL